MMHHDEHGHEHPHGEMGHTSTHSHPHSHEHSEHSEIDKCIALMGYMLEHNRHHMEELARMTEKLKSAGQMEASALLQAGVQCFAEGNDRLEEALNRAKEN